MLLETSCGIIRARFSLQLFIIVTQTAQLLIGLKHSIRSGKIVHKRFYEPVKLENWIPSITASAGFQKEQYEASGPDTLLSGPAGYDDDNDDDPGEDDPAPSNVVGRKRITLDEVKLARKGYSDQAYKDLEYKN